MTSTTTDRRLGVNAGQAVKVPCVAATTANITLSGEQTIDTVACVTGDRVLVKDQTDGSQNGIYQCNSSSWGRDYDWDGPNDVVKGTYVYVSGGAVGNKEWRVSTSNPITIGTTNVALVESSVAGGASKRALVWHGTQTVSNATPTELAFSQEIEDTDNVHDVSTNNERLVVPAGVSAVRLVCTIQFQLITSGTFTMKIKKNSDSWTAGCPRISINGQPEDTYFSLSSALVPVIEGDYFTVELTHSHGTSRDSQSAWFSIEMIE